MESGTLPVVFQHRAIVQYSEVLQTLGGEGRGSGEVGEGVGGGSGGGITRLLYTTVVCVGLHGVMLVTMESYCWKLLK